MGKIKRREFLKTAAAATATSVFGCSREAQGPSGATVWDEEPSGATVWVVHGTDVKKMMATGMAKMGGFEAFVKSGQKCTIKANVSFPAHPFQAANTNPLVVGEAVRACLKAGAARVVVPEHLVSLSGNAFEINGNGPAVEKAGGQIYAAEEAHFEKVSLPRGKVLKTCEVVKDVLHTGCLINIPVAKHHSGTGLSLSMKNWMGSVKDRSFWHQNQLDQCIADFATFIRPKLIIVDATTIMVSNGPRGPGDTRKPNQIIFGSDPVAVDAYASTLFGKKPFEIDHIRIAHEMGVGCGDLNRIKVIELRTA